MRAFFLSRDPACIIAQIDEKGNAQCGLNYFFKGCCALISLYPLRFSPQCVIINSVAVSDRFRQRPTTGALSDQTENGGNMFHKKAKVVYQNKKAPDTPPPSFLRKVIGGVLRFETLFFAAAFLWWELVFKLATIRSGFSWNLCIIALFSAGYAAVPVLLTSLFREKPARILRSS